MESNFRSSHVTPIEPNIPPFNDCVVRLDDDQERRASQPEKSADVHSTSSNDYSGQPLPTVVTDEQSGELSSEVLDSALSSNNLPQDDVPSVQNGTSTMTPCMLESTFLSNPVTPMDDVALPLEDTNEGSAITQPEQPTVVHLASSNGGRGQSLPAGVSDQQSRKRAFVKLDSAPDDCGEELTELPKEGEKSLSTAVFLT
ncbi:unnamed protein product [Dibothriocephalus latus]|uniref:Uncharacterized protein n=1 Tax=Dibothriocephalus latus TaxID=60516 RepID=A0A3P7NYC2_DIBLA|nr:unnamed protein product [Dibothriocephalus latus]